MYAGKIQISARRREELPFASTLHRTQDALPRQHQPFRGHLLDVSGLKAAGKGTESTAGETSAGPDASQPSQQPKVPVSTSTLLETLERGVAAGPTSASSAFFLPCSTPLCAYTAAPFLMYQPSARPCQIRRDHETTDGALLPAAQGLLCLGGLGRHDHR